MNLYLILKSTLTAIADAIREKLGSTDDMTPLEMPALIRSIQTGGGGQGLMDVSFDYNNGKSTWRGVVENNIIKNYYANNNYLTPPLWLKQPVVISTNDTITMSISSSSTMPYIEVGYISPFVSVAGRDFGNRIVISATTSNKTQTITYTGNTLVIDRLFLYSRTASINIATITIHLSVNDVVIF